MILACVNATCDLVLNCSAVPNGWADVVVPPVRPRGWTVDGYGWCPACAAWRERAFTVETEDVRHERMLFDV